MPPPSRREFQTQYLLCDCNLRWLLRWIKEKNVDVKNTHCSYPRSLQGQLLTSLKPEVLTCDPHLSVFLPIHPTVHSPVLFTHLSTTRVVSLCLPLYSFTHLPLPVLSYLLTVCKLSEVGALLLNAPLELPSFQMTPSQRQIVFRGDSLPFRCMASYIDEDMQVLWYQDGRMVESDAAQGIYIKKSMVQNCSLIASALTISNIQPGSTGNWECRVRTSRGNNTRTVHIVVLESSAKYCPPERVSNNKGEFRWPRTLAGITAYLPCNRLASGTGSYSGSSAEDRRAWRRCDRGGFWTEEDYSNCQYQKDVTRVLYIINQMPLNLTNAVTTARQLLVYTVEAANFSDKMDVIFVAQMIEKFGKFAEKYKEVGLGIRVPACRVTAGGRFHIPPPLPRLHRAPPRGAPPPLGTRPLIGRFTSISGYLTLS
ncbi:hypothetical protein JZ751_024167 [Albula glossodonta]|uniref:Adhesion G protein-coupled receptor A3 n=1 Tax=Albula glossodonta TaxID=121402 RepID=A0A8T2NHF1_9TELE|nr:hypothetical protein JZ751_024167 [Albula glossodonta]